ncbi:MAG: LPS export ABC transporter permease LptF [Lentibacter sp.]|uniref:LPS export ABC transporter permease LptF n=1 Tax=Lentibacter sp. TaxID=2024994 RepID=UPI00262B9B5D|nr:LPS export ABC transporter permease LptF [Lentibacter sp.]MDG1288499.1 LPS export ABC transporter permease LptF [Lentibacter sp.]
MARFDRYMLSQLMVLFGFFALVLVSIYWINRAVKLFDRLIGDGQTAMVFAEFTALTLPSVIRVVLPIAGFAATLYVTNRLSTESELTVMQATGFSPWRLARPVLYFGLIVGIMVAMLANVLVPASLEQLQLRETEISQNVTARLLTEGTFLHPTDGVTFYIREIAPDGRMNDVFLSDRRNPNESVTHTAASAYLIRTETGPALVMIDGLTQRLSRPELQLNTTHFADLSYSLSGMISAEDRTSAHLRHFNTYEMLTTPVHIQVRTEVNTGVFAEELHTRFTQPLFALAAVLLGFASLLSGGFSRFGVWRQIVIALILLILIKALESLVTEPVLSNSSLWPLLYLPALLGLAIAIALLARSAGQLPSLSAWRRRKAVLS